MNFFGQDLKLNMPGPRSVGDNHRFTISADTANLKFGANLRKKNYKQGTISKMKWGKIKIHHVDCRVLSTHERPRECSGSQRTDKNYTCVCMCVCNGMNCHLLDE